MRNGRGRGKGTSIHHEDTKGTKEHKEEKKEEGRGKEMKG